MLLKHFVLAAFMTRENLATHWAELLEENTSRLEKTWVPQEDRARHSGCGMNGKDEAQADRQVPMRGNKGAENPRASCRLIQGELWK